MSYNSAAYLAYEELRLTEPIQGTRRRQAQSKPPVFVDTRSEKDKALDSLTERERIEREDAWLAANGII